ncbi:hypothetical protein [Candidatus Enterococcus courvalinii]|uniref:Sensor histidine kinase NatK C-terminal domain-containing protein n=1 Tax=Candidatus Enterococcus courvalinii TaxID=2815329 RepID=A0ABS3I2Z3_9ENTE|nr:hypothetical protein [Enterococcus sp. MSG2901]MBO0483036.1 hypothetical protein [Enterococcus sp. MSG2901]
MIPLNNTYNKKDFFSTKMKWLSIIILSLLFLFGISYFFYFILSPADGDETKEIQQAWDFYSKDDPETRYNSDYLEKVPQVSKNETFVMETTLTKKLDQANILLKGNHQWIKVQLDQQVLYERTGDTTIKNPGLSLAVIDLPDNYAGKKLSIEVTSPYVNFAGIPPKVYIGTASSMVTFIFSKSVPQFLTMIIAILLAVGTLIMTIYIMYKQQRLDLSLIFLSCFALIVGFSAMSEDILSGLLFDPIVHSTLSHLFTVLSALLLISYYTLRMERYRRLFGIWCLLQVFFSFLPILYALFTPEELPEMMQLISIIRVFSTLVTSLACIGEAYHGNRFFVSCTPWIILIAISHCYLFIQSTLGNYVSTLNWSTILYMIILLVIVIDNISEHIRAVDQNIREANFLKTKTDLLEAHYESLRTHMKEISTLRLDFLDRMTTIQAMLQTNQPEQAENYLNELLDEAQKFEIMTSLSGHSLTNLILARYQEIASKQSIEIHFNAELPGELFVHDDDLTQLLIHILEHSFRESHAIENPLQRKIFLSMRVNDDDLIIHCEHNAHYDTNIFDRGITTELESQERFDLMMIKLVTDKYSGKLTQEKDEIFDRVTIQLSRI